MPDNLRPTWCGHEATSRQCCCYKTRAPSCLSSRECSDVCSSPKTDIHRRGGYVSFVLNFGCSWPIELPTERAEVPRVNGGVDADGRHKALLTI
jgi:hypothetical protein